MEIAASLGKSRQYAQSPHSTDGARCLWSGTGAELVPPGKHRSLSFSLVPPTFSWSHRWYDAGTGRCTRAFRYRADRTSGLLGRCSLESEKCHGQAADLLPRCYDG